jgi:hypothetical protein
VYGAHHEDEEGTEEWRKGGCLNRFFCF